MELEEVVIFLMKVAKEYKTYGDLDNPEFEDTKKIAKSIETVLQALKDSISKKKIRNLLIEKQTERKIYWEQNNIMLNFIDKDAAEITEKELEINDKSMQLYGSIKVLRELLKDK